MDSAWNLQEPYQEPTLPGASFLSENLPLPNTIADQFACSAPETDNDVQTAPAHSPASASLEARRQTRLPSGKSRRSSLFGEIEENENARVLWVKALWWATQEAKRRKALQKALQIQGADMQKAFAISMTAGGGNMPRAGLHESGAHQNTRDHTSGTNFNPVIPGNTQNGIPGPKSLAWQGHIFASVRKRVGSFHAWIQEDHATTEARKNSAGTESTESTRKLSIPGHGIFWPWNPQSSPAHSGPDFWSSAGTPRRNSIIPSRNSTSGNSTSGSPPPPGLHTRAAPRGVSSTFSRSTSTFGISRSASISSFPNTNHHPSDKSQEEEGIVLRTLNHRYWTWLTIFCMAWVLVGRDIYVLLDPPVSADRPVYGLFVICALQIVIHFLLIPFDRDYFLGFYFWLDVITLASVVPEVVYVFSGQTPFDVSAAEVARTGRAVGGITRMVRVMRMMQIVASLTTIFIKFRGSKKNMFEDQSTTKLAILLEKEVAKTVMICILIMLVLMVTFDITSASNEAEEQALVLALQFSCRPLARCMGTVEEARLLSLLPSLYSSICIEEWKAAYLEDTLKSFIQSQHARPIIFLQVSNTTIFGVEDDYETKFRRMPRSFVIQTFQLGFGSGQGVVHLGNKAAVARECVASLSTIFVVFCIATIVSVGLDGLRNKILGPLERISKIINNLMNKDSEDVVINVSKPGEATCDFLEMLSCSCKGNVASNEEHVYEVETAVLRVGKLLQLGLGEAGSKIIKANMKNGDMVFDRGGELVHAIFGFCDIRNFTDCTEVLRADIVNLVNAVARHIHKCTVENYGEPNKNIGDAFLLVWKPKGDVGISMVADSSLRCYVRAIIQMQMCKELRRWERTSVLQNRMPGFTVQLGFGLHYGWAIEGAIGSNYKIDASYLSPHVNMASRLEAATKQYGTAILMSDSLYLLLSSSTQQLCRLIDRVAVKGSTKPVYLYTYDVPNTISRGGQLADDTDITDLNISNENFFAQMAPPSTSVEFRLLHKRVMDFYLGGISGKRADWKKATELLQECLQMRPDDGPCHTILKYIQSTGEGGSAPKFWQGFRALSEK